MKLIENEKGKAIGRVNVAATLRTMEPGEIWKTDRTAVDFDYLHQTCSKLKSETGTQFHVSSPAVLGNLILVERVK